MHILAFQRLFLFLVSVLLKMLLFEFNVSGDKIDTLQTSNTDFALKSDSFNLCVKDFTPYAT